MDARLKWHGRLTFSGESDSGFTLPLGSKKSVGGDEDGFIPMELFAVGLGGCTAMDVISILNKKRQDITDFEVKVHMERAAEHPRVFTSALVEYHVTGHDVAEQAVLRAIQLSGSRYCPAQAMLGELMAIELRYHIYEDEGDGNRKVVSSGEYTLIEESLEPRSSHQ